jgi:hypothetical protein
MPQQPPPSVSNRLGKFEQAIFAHFKPKRGKSNLAKLQARILQEIRGNENIIIAHADKNLGPVGIDTEKYIRWALDEHLLDTTTYVQETEEEARVAANALFTEIYQWTQTHQVCDSLKEDHLKYIRYWINQNLSDPFGYFYLTIKIHKGPLSTRPVCSDCTSLVHPLGKWLDQVLQPITASQPFYFKDSFTLKEEINKLILLANASIITFDAIAMYTNIDIDDSIAQKPLRTR